MASADEKKTRRAWLSAALTVTFVALFAFAFIGVVMLLDNYATQRAADDNIAIDTVAPTEPFHVLLIGSDSRKGTALYTGKPQEHAQVDQHSDIMTLMRIDPKTHLITLVTIPRDTLAVDSNNKINDALLTNDPMQVVNAVGALTGIYADYYMMTTFISFENLVNAIGGIDIRVPVTVSVPDPGTGKKVTVKAGKNRHLNGAEALVLARARDEYGDYGDVHRQTNVRNIERTIIAKMLAQGADFNVEHALSILEDDTKTNLSFSTAGLLMLDFVQHADEVQFYDCTGPYIGSQREDGAWVVTPDPDGWKRLMEVVEKGEDPSGIVPLP